MKLLAVVTVLGMLAYGTHAEGMSSGTVAFPSNGPAMDLTGMKEVWTEWLNFDTYTGTGDYENVKYWWNRYNEKAKGNCMMECENPVAMQWDLADGYDEEQKIYIDKCVKLDMEKMTTSSRIYPGLNCFNSKQNEDQECTKEECEKAGMRSMKREDIKCDRCPDFKVKYACLKPIKTDLTRAVSGNTCGASDSEKREVELIELDMQLSEATRNLAEKENEIMEEQRALRNERKLEAEKENEDEEYKRLLGLLKTYLDDKE